MNICILLERKKKQEKLDMLPENAKSLSPRFFKNCDFSFQLELLPRLSSFLYRNNLWGCLKVLLMEYLFWCYESAMLKSLLHETVSRKTTDHSSRISC